MGNEISAVGRKKVSLSMSGKERPASQASLKDTQSDQETVRAPSTIKTRLAKLKGSISRNQSPHNASSAASTIDAASHESREHLPSTDGASTPMNEAFRITLPTPSLVTDEHMLSLSLDAVSPADVSTITQGSVEGQGSPASRTQTPTTSFLPLSEDSSSSTSTPHRQERPTSDTLIVRPRPYFPVRSVRLDKVPRPPLQNIHWRCYQSHRHMNRSPNTHHPVPCMTCGIEDEQMRWKCVWCCLRICSGCIGKLDKTQTRDLRALIQELENGVNWSQGCE